MVQHAGRSPAGRRKIQRSPRKDTKVLFLVLNSFSHSPESWGAPDVPIDLGGGVLLIVPRELGVLPMVPSFLCLESVQLWPSLSMMP